jgi:hypothetical protein
MKIARSSTYLGNDAIRVIITLVNRFFKVPPSNCEISFGLAELIKRGRYTDRQRLKLETLNTLPVEAAQ